MSWITDWQCRYRDKWSRYLLPYRYNLLKVILSFVNSTIDKLFPDDIRIVPQISLCLPAPCTSVGWISAVLFVNKSFFFLTSVECGLWRKRSSVGDVLNEFTAYWTRLCEREWWFCTHWTARTERSYERTGACQSSMDWRNKTLFNQFGCESSWFEESLAL